MSTPRDRGLGHALRIQREHAEPADWKAAIEAIEDEAERQVAREYLRVIWQRTQVVKRAQGTGN